MLLDEVVESGKGQRQTSLHVDVNLQRVNEDAKTPFKNTKNSLDNIVS
jgi:hypothetical protein